MAKDRLLTELAEALLTDYSVVYHVNATTGEYHWFSYDPAFYAFNSNRDGSDFFAYIRNEVVKIVHEDDRQIFTRDLQRENLLNTLENGEARWIRFRMTPEGRSVYYGIRVIRRNSDEHGDVFVLGVRNIDREERRFREGEQYNNIAKSLAENYEDIFYIDIDTGKYMEFSPSEMYESMNVPTLGQDFYRETRDNARRYAHPDDQEFAVGLYYKEKMLKNLKGKKSFSYKYRIMVCGEYRYFRFTVLMAEDGAHFVLCVKDVQDEITAEHTGEDHITFSQIAESLAVNYDVIYYVELEDNSYFAYTSGDLKEQLELSKEGPDFFAEAKKAASTVVYPDDADKAAHISDKDYLLTCLEDRKLFVTDYRLIIRGQVRHTRFTVRKTSDGKHFIVCLENIDSEVRREQDHLRALNSERELARRDELTGIKNKTAYAELEKSVQSNIDNGMDYLSFAIAVCDINYLKQVNDTEGHKAGDEYIRESSKLLCEIFSHSPVFRIGGDEFLIFLRGSDYPDRERLIGELKAQVRENLRRKEGPVVAVGFSDYIPESDTKVSDVFGRADRMMYEDKRRIKEEEKE